VLRISGIMYLSLLYWLITLSIISSRFNRVIHMIGFPSFLRLQNACTKFSLSICMSIDIRVVSISWLSWITLQWTPMCKYLFKAVLWVFWDINLEMGLLELMVVPFWAFRGTSIILSIVAASFFIPTKSAQDFQCLHILDNTCYFLCRGTQPSQRLRSQHRYQLPSPSAFLAGILEDHQHQEMFFLDHLHLLFYWMWSRRVNSIQLLLFGTFLCEIDNVDPDTFIRHYSYNLPLTQTATINFCCGPGIMPSTECTHRTENSQWASSLGGEMDKQKMTIQGGKCLETLCLLGFPW